MSTTGWGRSTWGNGPWGTGVYDEVTLSGFTVTVAQGDVEIDAQAVITLTTLASVTTFLGDVEVDAQAGISLTGFSVQVAQGSVLIWNPIPARPSGNWVAVSGGASGGWTPTSGGASGGWTPVVT